MLFLIFIIMQVVPSHLEKLILQGKASYNVFNHAFGMFGAIPLTAGATAIITNITWYPFQNPINELGELAPAVQNSHFQIPTPVSLTNVTWSLNAGPIFLTVFDPTTPATILATQAAFNVGLNANYPGFTAIVTFQNTTAGSYWYIQVTSPTPGNAFNGNIPTVLLVPPSADQFDGPFNGGSDGSTMSYRQFFNYLEYQLKLDTKKAVNYYQFRNPLRYKITSPFNFLMEEFINLVAIRQNFAFLQAHPIQIPTYQICEEYIKLTISRNAMLATSNNTYNLLNNKNANEMPNPNGVSDTDVLLDNLMSDQNGHTQQYNPPSLKNNFAVTQPRSIENYKQDIYKKGITNLGSQLSDLQDIEYTHPNLLPINPYISYPLVSIGYVLINKNAFDELINT